MKWIGFVYYEIYWLWIYVYWETCDYYQIEYMLICDNIYSWNWDIGCIEKWNEYLLTISGWVGYRWHAIG